MKLGDGVEMAIHCAAALADLVPGATISAADLAGGHGVSASYLVKHLKRLVSAGVLESVSGPLGGYRLARSPQAITLADIVLAVEGHDPAFRCQEIRRRGPSPLPDDAYPGLCAINHAMLKAERAYRAALAETTLADILQQHEKTADPRVLARGCAMRDLVQRRQPGSAG